MISTALAARPERPPPRRHFRACQAAEHHAVAIGGNDEDKSPRPSRLLSRFAAARRFHDWLADDISIHEGRPPLNTAPPMQAFFALMGDIKGAPATGRFRDVKLASSFIRARIRMAYFWARGDRARYFARWVSFSPHASQCGDYVIIKSHARHGDILLAVSSAMMGAR